MLESDGEASYQIIIFFINYEDLDLDPKANCRRTAKSLTFYLNGDLFLSDDADSVFYTTNLRQLNSEDSFETVIYQVSNVKLLASVFKGWLFI